MQKSFGRRERAQRSLDLLLMLLLLLLNTVQGYAVTCIFDNSNQSIYVAFVIRMTHITFSFCDIIIIFFFIIACCCCCCCWLKLCGNFSIVICSDTSFIHSFFFRFSCFICAWRIDINLDLCAQEMNTFWSAVYTSSHKTTTTTRIKREREKKKTTRRKCLIEINVSQRSNRIYNYF